MKFYGVTMEGKFVNQSLATKPLTYQGADEGRLIYTEDDGLLWWGDGQANLWRSIGTGGSGDANEAEDMYSDLLRTTIFYNASWDEFEDQSLIDTDPAKSTMIGGWDELLTLYTYTAGQTLQTTDLWDTLATASQATYIMVSVDYISTDGSPTTPEIYVTANGSAASPTWDLVQPHDVHSMSVPGTDIRMKFVANDSGLIRSWAIYYNKDLSVSCSREALTRTTTTITSTGENTVYVDYQPDAVVVFLNGDMLDTTDYTATDGTSITIDSPDLQIGDVVVVLSFGTSLLAGEGGGGTSGSFVRKIAASDGDNTFSGSFTIGSTLVFVNGMLLDTSDFTNTGSLVTIRPAPLGPDIYKDDIIFAQRI